MSRDNSRRAFYQSGISHRQWLAGLALQGLLSSTNKSELSISLFAKLSYEFADGMLAYEELEGDNE